MMSPSTLYYKDVTKGLITDDPLQHEALHALNNLAENINGTSPIKKIVRYLQQLLLGKNDNKSNGIYLYGGVGIGKTYLLDILYESLETLEKKRVHFHQFMREIHERLHDIEGRKNPVDKIIEDMTASIEILCFDEFFVQEIADAMLLRHVLEALFKRGVKLIVTSNIEPHDLYKKGLQRGQFIPAIDLINDSMDVIHMKSLNDYRTQGLSKLGSFFTPISKENKKSFEKLFNDMELHGDKKSTSISVNNRELNIIKKGEDIIWFDFEALVSPPVSKNDYLEIANTYHSVFISNVRAIEGLENDYVVNFMHLIDILYDSSVNLILLSHCGVDNLYLEGPYLKSFDRTLSRLSEMQTKDYHHKSHNLLLKS